MIRAVAKCLGAVVALVLVTPSATAQPVGSQRWTSRYDGPAPGYDIANAITASPDGTKVFVTGVSSGRLATDYATVAYDASTGDELWVSRYVGPRSRGNDLANDIATNPDGTKVFVTGESPGRTASDYATVAYDASSGATLWVRRYRGHAGSLDAATAIAVSGDGNAVVVTGSSIGSVTDYDYATVAYDAASGLTRWVRRYDGPASARDVASDVIVPPAGSAVVVTGASTGSTTSADFATISYDTETGRRLWLRRHNGSADGDEGGVGLAATADGSRVFVAGPLTVSTGPGSYDQVLATFAYDGSTGSRLWLRRYDGPGEGDSAASIAARTDGSMVFVTGISYGVGTLTDYATIAYDGAGRRAWARRYTSDGEEWDEPTAIALNPAASMVFVTGYSFIGSSSWDFVTLAYSALTGDLLWRAVFGDGESSDAATSIAVAHDGRSVYVTGSAGWTDSIPASYETVSYAT